LGYRFQSWLSMGVSLMVLPEIRTVNRVFTPNAVEPDTVYLNIETENGLREAIVFGLRIQPHRALSIGLTVQDELGFVLNGFNEIQVRGTNDEAAVLQPLGIMDGYTPPRAVVALAGALEGGAVLNLDAIWQGWSRFRDHHLMESGFEDVYEFRLGAEWPFSEMAFLRLGAAWLPSPVPEQAGRTNYVDNDRVVMAAGGGRRFDLRGETMQIDVSIQLHSLVTRTTVKAQMESPQPCADGIRTICDEFPDPGAGATPAVRAQSNGLQTGNTGFPGYTHGGYLIHAGVDVRWLF
jgi:hypothetical protein